MYYRTQNENGTFNTRCLDCLMSVATAVESPNTLEAIEAKHLCAEKVLQFYAQMTSSAENTYNAL